MYATVRDYREARPSGSKAETFQQAQFHIFWSFFKNTYFLRPSCFWEALSFSIPLPLTHFRSCEHWP